MQQSNKTLLVEAERTVIRAALKIALPALATDDPDLKVRAYYIISTTLENMDTTDKLIQEIEK